MVPNWIQSMRRPGPPSNVRAVKPHDTYAHGTTVDDLARRIHERILDGELAAGTWLRQETLAADFRVSRTPIREALRKLQADGVVTVSPNRGALIRWPTALEVHEAYVIRAELEGLSTRLAVEHAEPHMLERLRAAVRLFPRALDPSKTDQEQRSVWRAANDHFHDTIIAAAQNDRLERSITDLHRAFPRNLTWAALHEDTTLFDRSAAEHQHILEAIEGGDPRVARERMLDHVLSAGALVATWFKRHAPPPAG